jgi:hypothetical protein
VCYFGLNPRQCFGASQRPSNLAHSKGDILKKIRSIDSRESLQNLLTQTFTTRGLSHSIFELSPGDDGRLLSQARVGAVSPWALDMLLQEYERRKADAAADFYESIAGLPYAGSLKGRLRERQVLKYFDSLQDLQTFSLRSLSDSSISEWIYPGPTHRITFQSRAFTFSLRDAVNDGKSIHFVPADPNFRAVDSILYYPADGLRFIQVTFDPNHDLPASGFQRIQSWLKLHTPLASLRPSTAKGKHWDIIFVVPDYLAPDFKKQSITGDTTKGEWAHKIDQYVLVIKEETIWGRTLTI